jgi:hypothetical protein
MEQSEELVIIAFPTSRISNAISRTKLSSSATSKYDDEFKCLMKDRLLSCFCCPDADFGEIEMTMFIGNNNNNATSNIFPIKNLI